MSNWQSMKIMIPNTVQENGRDFYYPTITLNNNELGFETVGEQAGLELEVEVKSISKEPTGGKPGTEVTLEIHNVKFTTPRIVDTGINKSRLA